MSEQNAFQYNKTKSYAILKLVSKKLNDVYLEDGGNSSDAVVELEFTTDPNVTGLITQTKVFSNNSITDGRYNYERLFNTREDDTQRVLQDIYAYSYLKAHYSCLFKNSLTVEDMGGLAFIGHSKMYALRQQTKYVFSLDGVSVVATIKPEPERVNIAKFSVLLKHFKNIADRSKDIIIGSDPFIIPYYEMKLSKLVDDGYAKKAGGEPEIMAGLTDYIEAVGLPKVIAEDNSKGRFIIVPLKNKDSMEIRSLEQNPLFNSFKNKEGNILYSQEVNGNYKIKFNESFFFNLANFICINEENSDVKRFYRKNSIGKKQKFLFNSEVYVNTGIKPTISVSDSDLVPSLTPLSGIPLQEILDRLRDLPSSILTSESIQELINEIIKEFLDEEIKRQKGK